MASPNIRRTYKGNYSTHTILKPLYEPSPRERFWTSALATIQFAAMAGLCGYFNQLGATEHWAYYAPWLFFCGINGSTMMCVFSRGHKRKYTTLFFKLLKRIGTCRQKSLGF